MWFCRWGPLGASVKAAGRMNDVPVTITITNHNYGQSP